MVCALTAQCAYDAVVAAESAPSKELCELAASLHDVLLSLEGEGELQEAIASLCEAWWANETPNREALAPQCVPYVLAKALDSGRLADVKRCYAMRDALALFDYDDESIGSLKLLLLRCTFAPAFLRAPDGRRFLAGLFCLSSSMVPDLMAIVRNQIPSGRKSLLDAYSDVLLKAWKGAAGQALYAVEYSCVQELMRACLHARTPALATSVRRVLAAFYTKKAKAGREVEGMAVRLWEPILFKALSAANTAVRRNAVHGEGREREAPLAKREGARGVSPGRRRLRLQRAAHARRPPARRRALRAARSSGTPAPRSPPPPCRRAAWARGRRRGAEKAAGWLAHPTKKSATAGCAARL